jgi:hypothetical protein
MRYIQADKFAVSPFIAIYAAGFLFIGFSTLAQALGCLRNSLAR